MGNQFIVGTTPAIVREYERELRSQHLYKSLSLLLAQRAGVKAPASLLLLALRLDLIVEFANRWRLPLMMRVDYRTRPKSKPIGGIPIYKLETVCTIAGDLLNRDCLPLFHPHFDRFKDVFSLGAILTKEGNSAEIEVVGRGFDAGDLRLGQAIPHEAFKLDLRTGALDQRKTISRKTYIEERSKRSYRIRKLKAYSEFVNRTSSLIDPNSLGPNLPEAAEARAIPQSYRQMPAHLVRDLLAVLRKTRSGILPGLPESKIYVASLSYLGKQGWMLWDVYGDWYQR